MSKFDYNDPIIQRRRSGTSNDPFLPMEETHVVGNGKVILTELPFEKDKVRVSGDNKQWFEIKKGIPKPNEYIVDYKNKIVTFNTANNGKQLNFEYVGLGLVYLPSSMVYTKQNNGDVVETLDEVIDTTSEVRDATELIRQQTELIKDEANHVKNETEQTRQNIINDYEEVVTQTKVVILPFVDTYSQIATTYPNPQLGWTVQVKADGIEYRYNGTQWQPYRMTGLVSNGEIVSGAIPPQNINVIWLDTSTPITKLKRYNNTTLTWEEIKTNTKFDTLHNSVTISTNTNTVNIGISAFNILEDALFVTANSISLIKGTDYTIHASGVSIVKTSGQWNSGTIFDFTVLKTERANHNFSDGSLISDGSITENKVVEGLKISPALVDKSGVVHANLKDRLLSVDTQMAQKAIQTDLNTTNVNVSNLQSNKADKTYVNEQLTLKRDKITKLTEADMDETFLQQMAGTTSINTIPQDDSVTLGKLSFAHEDVALTTKDISITSNSSFVMTITLTDNTVTKNTLYRYGKDGRFKGSHAINQNIATYTLNNYQCLVWDLTDNTIKILADSTLRTEKSILLVQNSNGNAVEGAFVRFFAAKKAESMRFSAFSNSIDLDDQKSFYSYAQDGNIHFRWTGNIRIATRYKIITKSFTDLLNDLGAYYKRDSPEWVKDCCRLEKGFFVAYDDTLGKFVVNSFSYQTISNMVIIAENRNGFFGGELLGLVATQAIVNSRLRTNHIKPYYMETIDRKTNEVISIQSENTFTFGFSTDHHVNEWENGITNHAYNVMEKVAKEVNADAILNGGDNVQYGRNDKYFGLGALKHSANKLTSKDKTYFAIGNHDYNGISSGLLADGKQRKSWTLTPYETYSILGKHHEKDVVWGSKELMYYYKDFEDKKIRVIFLNTSDTGLAWVNDNDGKEDYLQVDPLMVAGVRQQQAEWLANIALNFADKTDKAEWHTMIVAHVPVFRSGDGMTWNTPFLQNDVSIRIIIRNFIEGTNTAISHTDTSHNGTFNLNLPIDYRTQGIMKFIGVFSGHNHLDRLVTTNYGLTNISTTAAYPDHTITSVEPSMVRNPLEYNEFALDMVVVDKVQRKVTLKRYGAGVDREFSY